MICNFCQLILQGMKLILFYKGSARWGRYMFRKCLWREVNKFLNKCHQILNWAAQSGGKELWRWILWMARASAWYSRSALGPRGERSLTHKEITHPQRDHSPTIIKNFCAMSTMWNTQVSRRSNRATRSSSLANDSDCLLVGWELDQRASNDWKQTTAHYRPLVVTCPPTGWTASELSRQKWRKLAQSTASSLPTTLVKKELPTGWSFLCGEILIWLFPGSEPTWWLTVEKLLEKKHGLSFKLVQLSSKWEALAKGKKVFNT